MMGIQEPPQGKLFYSNINLGKRIRDNHPLRKIDQFIELDFAYKEVEDKYGCDVQLEDHEHKREHQLWHQSR